jgi:TonB family protein
MSDTWKQCEGQVVDNNFKLLQHLGGSDHSVVFLTERGGKEKPQKAAIKFVQADAANPEIQLSRWKQAAQISHPNLIKLFESGRCHLAGMDLLYVVMEYAAENLAEFLPQRGLSPTETRDMLEPFLDTLTHLHGRGFVHGRIKPGNILAIDDQLKLSSDSVCRIGEASLGAGKANAYTPPEPSDAQTSPAGDVWALGVTLVETLTQRAPERNSSQSPKQEGAPEELPVADTLTQPFLDIARHCLRLDPQRRWTVAEISACLNPTAATPPSTQNLPAAVKPVPPPTPQPVAQSVTPLAVPAASAPPAKPPAPIDPLSIPLSPVSPPLGAKKHALENQMIAGKGTPARPYYILAAVVLALTIGAMLAIPRFRNHQPDTEPATSTAPSEPAVQPPARPSTSPTPARVAPLAPAKTPPKSEPKPAAPAANQPAQRSALQPPQEPAQDKLQTTGEKQSARKEDLSASAAPASLKSAVPRSDAAPAPPFVANRDASIATGAVTPGESLNQILPEVSQKSRNTIHGTVRVVIKVNVDSSGNVTGAEIASAPSHFFADAALQAARRWDFAPAKVDGHAVPSEWLLHFDFTQTNTDVTPLPTKP